MGFVLGASVYGLSLASVLAATAPLDGTAIRPLSAVPTLSAPRPDQETVRAATGNPLWAIPLNSMPFTRSRPLFSPSRRPPPPTAIAAPSASPPKPAAPDHPLLTLVGTAIGQSRSIGVFVDQATKNVIRLRTGESHDGWTLRAIEARTATFEKDRRLATLALPARSATDQVAASIPPPMPFAAPPPGRWVDGDGRSISPPPQPSQARAGMAPRPTWPVNRRPILTPAEQAASERAP